MCGYFGIGFIDFMLKSKSLLECTNLCFPKEYNKNDKIILIKNIIMILIFKEKNQLKY